MRVNKGPPVFEGLISVGGFKKNLFPPYFGGNLKIFYHILSKKVRFSGAKGSIPGGNSYN